MKEMLQAENFVENLEAAVSVAIAAQKPQLQPDASGLDPMAFTAGVAVNVSPREIQQRGFERNVERILESTGVDPRFIELELTESAVMREPKRTAEVLAQLDALSVRTSIDDFGTGFSSLAELRRFPISRLKIDRSFIEQIPDDTRTAAITRAIIDMAHCLGMRTVAEGVERTDQLEFLKKRGCEEAQGYLFAPPVPAAEVQIFLRGPGSFRLCEAAGV